MRGVGAPASPAARERTARRMSLKLTLGVPREELARDMQKAYLLVAERLRESRDVHHEKMQHRKHRCRKCKSYPSWKVAAWRIAQ